MSKWRAFGSTEKALTVSPLGRTFYRFGVSLGGFLPVISLKHMRISQSFPILILLWFVLLVQAKTGFAADSDVQYGPLHHEFNLTLDSGRRTEILGPLYYQQDIDDEWDATRTWAAPPLFSYVRNEELDYAVFDFLWKGLTYNRHGTEYRFQILQLWSFAGGSTQSETNLHRFTIFPIYFQQRSAIPEKNYTALVPIYGHLQGRLFRDEVNFVLFPLYARSRKRDVITDNYLFPVIHRRHGHGLSGWQVWPLIGHEHKSVTTKTNNLEEAEIVAGHDKMFVLWPLFGNSHSGVGTDNPTHEQFFLPFYSYLRSPKRDTTTFPWPLGYTHIVDREKKYEEWAAPLPIIVFARGEGRTVNRVWPFYSKAENKSQTSDWILWPIYKHNALRTPPLERERTRILFFLYSDSLMTNADTGLSSRRLDLWPVFTARRGFDGKSRLQIINFLEPFLPNNVSVERDLSPLWSLWRSEANPVTGASSQSLLWNLYRRDAAPEGKKCSLLFGLIQYQSGPVGPRWRLFHIPMGRDQRPPETSPR